MSKNIKRKQGMIWNKGYRDGCTGVKAAEKDIPPRYRKDYELGHTQGMVDSHQFVSIHPLEKQQEQVA